MTTRHLIRAITTPKRRLSANQTWKSSNLCGHTQIISLFEAAFESAMGSQLPARQA